ncbi:hypothetical protein DFH29DRAFT_878403 [Suillus ampliporus]|nr:hypothetical protein DFH29DRAFT_878403 [Suillus ampliporus]
MKLSLLFSALASIRTPLRETSRSVPNTVLTSATCYQMQRSARNSSRALEESNARTNGKLHTIVKSSSALRHQYSDFKQTFFWRCAIAPLSDYIITVLAHQVPGSDCVTDARGTYRLVLVPRPADMLPVTRSKFEYNKVAIIQEAVSGSRVHRANNCIPPSHAAHVPEP